MPRVPGDCTASRATVFPGQRFLRFRCTSCGNCCRDPLLPITDTDLRRIVRATRADPRRLVDWIGEDGIEMDEPDAFAVLRRGKRVMVLRHARGRCLYLGDDDRCTIYSARPMGCRVFPFDPEVGARGGIKRLRLIEATTCHYELDGKNPPERLVARQAQHEQEVRTYRAKIAAWNQRQRVRRRDGLLPGTGADFLAFLGFRWSTASGSNHDSVFSLGAFKARVRSDD